MSTQQFVTIITSVIEFGLSYNYQDTAGKVFVNWDVSLRKNKYCVDCECGTFFTKHMYTFSDDKR